MLYIPLKLCYKVVAPDSVRNQSKEDDSNLFIIYEECINLILRKCYKIM